MIVLENLTKIFRLDGSETVVFENVNVEIPTGVSVGILGRNGAGKSTLLRIIGGAADPTSGRVLTDGEISFPVGFAGSFHGDMTGAQNTRFVARIYGVDTESLMAFVEDFAELGQHFHLPLRTYSSGMKSRLAFGVSMGLKFDTYLIDEVTAVGDDSFKKKSQAVFRDRMKNSGALFVSHAMSTLREMCEAGMVLEKGVLTYYPDLDEAIDHHVFNMKRS